ncbi:hypothetical protein ACTXG6_16080 [Pseudonocardia sp. Cha107L01]|jgi:hypothetical protein|uniref:hypothetical protein n=1 Tax=Pseudonocardia sp. Cha107L01 TaxID=3457576 RepID=UPI00403EC7BE
MGPLDLLWLFFIFSTFQPLVQQKALAYQRGYALRQLEKRDGSRVITGDPSAGRVRPFRDSLRRLHRHRRL